jgi:uncharacterized repeat protein (TIGR01451 family)
MIRKFVLIVALIGFTLIVLPSVLYFKARATIDKSRPNETLRAVDHSTYRQASSAKELNTSFAANPISFNRNALAEFLTPANAALGNAALGRPARPLGLTFTVNNLNDVSDATPGDGVCFDGISGCSLRAAIEESNATPGADQINFSIDVTNVATIAPATPLPDITDPVVINGYTQLGASQNTQAVGSNAILLIELSGINLGAANGLTITAGNSSVQGLIINRFASNGIVLSGSGGNSIQGNFIGTDSTGNADLGNGAAGVRIQSLSTNNTIGGSTPADRNVISGNNGDGILIIGAGSDDNLITNNYIGTNAAGTGELGNSGNGVNVTIAANNTIGGTTAAERNIISGNDQAGVLLINGATNNRVRDNYIGTDVNGNADLGNSGAGVSVGGPNNTIGGLEDVPGNVISANKGAGINIIGSSGTNTLVVNNFIGTNAAGTAALGNSVNGIIVATSANNLIQSNIISGNSQNGVLIFAGGTNNQIVDNFMGTTISGTAPLGNTANGVNISGSSGNFIGDAGTIGPNTIAFNTLNGVLIGSGTANAIISNSIFSNGALGIELNPPAPPAPTPNDVCDADVGANNLQNFPALTSATSDVMSTTIQGTLNSTANTGFLIEFFANPSCDPSGFGEGQTLIGSINVLTDASCNAVINAVLPNSTPAGTVITATATDPSGNTSEFSQCVTVAGGVPPSADLSITKTDSPDPAASGSQVTYTIVVTNNGPTQATGVMVTDVVPSSGGGGYTFASVNSQQGSCVAPPPGGTGTVTCSLGSMNSGATVTITLIVNVTAPSGSSIVNMTSVSSNTTPDPVPTNNSASATTSVVAASPCVMTCPANIITGAGVSQCGARVNYPLPTTSGSCFVPSCNPVAGSFFPVGTTTVTCTSVAVPAGVTCSFTVTVLDNIAPTITCPANISIIPPQGQRSAVVNYPAPLVTDNCRESFGTDCNPPSGASFPVGTTTVTCVAIDAGGNTASCSFLVAIGDNLPPTLVCPANVVVQATGEQCATIVNFPAPNITGSPTGTGVVCVPPPGSTFPAGTTAVTCTATTPAGLRATCGFSVTVNGAPQARLMLENNKSALEFGPAQPVRKPKKRTPGNCDCSETFMIENTGCGVLNLDIASIMRTGSDVDSGRITDPNDSSFFTVTIVNPDGTERPATCDTGSPCIRINPGQKLTFRVVFKPVIPAAFSGKTRGLSASEVVPDRITSKITFNQSGGAPLVINLIGRVPSALKLVDPVNPRKPARVILERSGNDFTVTYAVFDPNLDANRTQFEFFDNRGNRIGQAIDVDLTGPVRDGNLVRGQSFVVVQRFTGARDNPEVASVRVTVFDPKSSDTAPGALSSSNSAARIESQSRTRSVILFPPRAKLNQSLP